MELPAKTGINLNRLKKTNVNHLVKKDKIYLLEVTEFENMLDISIQAQSEFRIFEVDRQKLIDETFH